MNFIVGGYTKTSEAPGVHLFSLNPDGKIVEEIGQANGCESPSYCTPAAGNLYAASETPDHGGLARFTFDEGGQPKFADELNYPDAAGTCFVLPHPNLPMLYGANYNSGSVSYCPISSDGSLKTPVMVVQHEGRGALRSDDDPNKDRQLSPHVHTLSFVPGTSLLAAVDLGLDLIVVYQLGDKGAITDASSPCSINSIDDPLTAYDEDTSNGHVSVTRTCSMPERSIVHGKSFNPPSPGAVTTARLPVRPAALVEVPQYFGPRIIAYHPSKRLAALICELACELLLYRFDKTGTKWELVKSVNLLEGVPGTSNLADPPLSAHCEFTRDGRFLYTSTRGTDMLSVFELDDEGTPQSRFDFPCGGLIPRHFALSPDDEFLVVANQTNNKVSVFKRDARTGLLEQVASADCQHPSCIVWH